MLGVRRILLLTLILLCLGLCCQATSYSSAKVNNQMSITISSSKDALIAVPEEDILLTLQAKPTNSHTESTPIDHNLYIKNNMNKKIKVRAALKDHNDFLKFYNDKPISPGKKVKLSLLIDENLNDIDSIRKFVTSEDEPLILIITADWKGGSAKIEKNIRIKFESNNLVEDTDLTEPTMPEKTTSDTKASNAPDSEANTEEHSSNTTLVLPEETKDQNEKSVPAVTAPDNDVDPEEKNIDEQIVNEQPKDTQENTTPEPDKVPESDY